MLRFRHGRDIIEEFYRHGESIIELSIPTENNAQRRAISRVWGAMKRPGFHVQMALGATVLLVVSIVGCRLTAITVPYAGPIVLAVFATVGAVQLIAAFWHSKGKTNLRDAALALPWAFILWAIIPFPVDIAARLGRHFNLQDFRFAGWDESVGVSVPALMRWSIEHWPGGWVNSTYSMLAPLIAIAVLLPSLTGKVKSARQFLTGNLVAFIVGLPVFALLPAIGPWSGYHLSPSALQVQCQTDLMQLRDAGAYIHHANGPICFPSFHVMWAVLCVQALWCYRYFRIPACILSGMIIVSTMTTGWHYFSDVVAGILLAVIAMLASEWLYRLG